MCLSDKCLALRPNYTGEFYNRDTICKNSLTPDIDFAWSTNRTSYAMDWGLICSKEDKVTDLMSFFFVGAFVGVITGTFIFDTAGRKTVTLIAILLAFVATLANAFISSYSVMLSLRVIQGFASFLVQTGVQLMAMEFTPTKLRSVASILVLFCWSIGTAICIGMSYILYNWHHIFLGTSVTILLTAIPIIFCPESPRFQLLKGREDEAKRTFKRIARIFDSPIVIEEVEIEYSDYKQNYWHQIKDFKKFPDMAKNTALLFLSYMMLSAHTYSVTYGWGQLGVDLFTAQALCVAGNSLVVVTGYQYLITERLGRRKALVVNISLLTVFSCLAIPKVSLSSTWTLSQVMCIVATVFNASSWMGLLLLASELSPTSHRGMIVCLNASAARIGAFVGPYMTLLFNVLDIRIVMAIFATLPVLCAILAMLCQDSTGKPIPAVPEEVGFSGKVKEDTEDDSALQC